MNSDEAAGQLHDKATRGGTLSPEEGVRLEAWLAAQDKAEAELFSSGDVESASADLRAQVNAALQQVGTITRSIQQLTTDNDSLRREVAALRSQLAARPVLRPA